MCLHPCEVSSIPEQTARVANAAFPKGNLYMKMRDAFDTCFKDEEFTDLFPSRGKPALTPWRLALVTVFQFVEGLSDSQAAEGVRARIDWKYSLSLDLEDTGFHSSVLCEFRSRLLDGTAESRLFESLLTQFKDRGLLKSRGKQRTDSTHVLSSVRDLNRLELLGETLRAALNALAETAPHWLLQQVNPEWFDRYSRRIESYRFPREEAERKAIALQMGADGFCLLQSLSTGAGDGLLSLRNLAPVETLRRVWVQQFYQEGTVLHLRGLTESEAQLPPAALRIVSPYDRDARQSVKRETFWTGYKVHLTETCDDEMPRLVTQVETTPATTADSEVTATIQAALVQAQRPPSEHIVDEGYTQASHLITSRSQYGIELIGPVARDGSRQAVANKGFDVAHFRIDWEARSATCPAGKQSVRWQPTKNARGSQFLLAVFAAADCRACELRPDCTRSKSAGRSLYLHPKEEHEALHAARQNQKTPEFRAQYAIRAGIEGTLSHGIRAFGLRQSRYVGKAKSHLQNLMIATATNFCRVFEWLEQTPLARTRQSPFARLKPIPISV